MEKTLIALLVCLGSNAMAQSPDSLQMRESELMKMGKISLTKIYMQLVGLEITTTPSMPFVNSLENVPSNSFTKARWKRINKSNYRHMKILNQNYKDLLPYADKADLVKSILYLEKCQREQMERKK
jgi:hypothetical protein